MTKKLVSERKLVGGRRKKSTREDRPRRKILDHEVNQAAHKSYKELCGSGSFQWIPVDELREQMKKNGVRSFQMYGFEKRVLSGRQSDGAYRVGRFAVRTKTGPPGANGLIGRPDYFYVKIWEVDKLKKR